MGTNYYAKLDECDKCKRYKEIHLGKSSYGWAFHFQLNDREYYKNIDEMKKWLRGKKIVDEYGRNVTKKEFWEMVELKQANHDFC